MWLLLVAAALHLAPRPALLSGGPVGLPGCWIGPARVASGGPGCVPKVEELMELCIDFPVVLDAADTPVIKGVLDAAERHNYTTPELEELRTRFIKFAEHRRGRLTVDFVCHVRS